MTIPLDAEYFESVGLAALSPEGKQSLAGAIKAEMSLRVGNALCVGMNDDQLQEFERITEMDEDTIRKVLDEHDHDHDNYQSRLDLPLQVLAEVASAVWLATYRPSYLDTVRGIHEELKEEVAARRAEILTTEGLLATEPLES